MSKRITILIYALTITVLAVSIIGFTYAWFSTEIDGDGGSVSVTTADLGLLTYIADNITAIRRDFIV